MSLGVLWKILVTQHSLPLLQEMQCEIVLYKEETVQDINFAQTCSKVVWTCSLRRSNQRQWKCVLWSQQSTFQLSLVKKNHFQLPTKRTKSSLCDGVGVD